MLPATKKLLAKVRWSTAAFFFASGVITATWASRIPEIQHKFNLSDAQWGGVLFALPLGLVTGLPVSSWTIAKFTSGKVMTIGGIIYSGLLCFLCLVPQVWVLVVLLFCFGFVRNLFTMALNTKAIEVQRLYDKPVIATFHGMWSVACLTAAAIGTLMIVCNVPPAWHFLIAAIIAITIIVINRRKSNSKKLARNGKRPFFIKPDSYLLILGLICFCAMMCEGTIFDWAVNYFDKVIKTGKSMTTAGYAAFIVTMSLGRFIGDRFIAFFGYLKMLLINGFLMAAGFGIAVIFPYLWSAAFGFLLIGLGDSIIVPIVYSLAGQSVKMPPGYSIASVTIIGYTGFLSGPLIIGSLSEAWGMRAAFIFVGVLCICISILSLTLSKFKTNSAAD